MMPLGSFELAVVHLTHGRYAEITVGFSQLSPHMYVILTVAVFLE
jgi:hypothetical protein